jgi:hypothetical protein
MGKQQEIGQLLPWNGLTIKVEELSGFGHCQPCDHVAHPVYRLAGVRLPQRELFSRSLNLVVYNPSRFPECLGRG